MPVFSRDDLEVHYADRGPADARPPVVLIHGLLLSAHLMERTARAIARRGRRVLLIDLHGHGRSSVPRDPARYTWSEFTADVIGLLDHVGAPRAVVGGLSLGANLTLAVGLAHPERLAAMVVEMPVLWKGHRVADPVFSRVARLYQAAGPLAVWPAAIRRSRLPLPIPEIHALRDVIGADPRVASAVLTGLLAEEQLGQDVAALQALDVPTLVIGHRGEPLHPLADARRLASLLPDARLRVASSILEYRLRPDRLADHIVKFLDDL